MTSTFFQGLSNILTQKATAQPSTVTNDSQKSVSSHDSFDYGVDDEILGALDENILELEATFATASSKTLLIRG